MLPCAIGSIPGVGSQGRSSGAVGDSEPAKVSPSPRPARAAHVGEKGPGRRARICDAPDQARELGPVGKRAVAPMQTTSAWNTSHCEPMRVRCPLEAPSRREPPMAKFPVVSAPLMSPPPTARTSPSTAGGGLMAGSTACAASTAVLQSPSVASAALPVVSRRAEKGDPCSRQPPHSRLPRTPARIVAIQPWKRKPRPRLPRTSEVRAVQSVLLPDRSRPATVRVDFSPRNRAHG
jgi:hypothetical protein